MFPQIKGRNKKMVRVSGLVRPIMIAAGVLLAIDSPQAHAMARRPPKAEPPRIELQSSPALPEAKIWRLSDLLEEGLKNNPELRLFHERFKAAKARVWQSFSWDDTMIGADFESIPRGRPDADRAANIEWMIAQKIPFPGKRFLKGRVAMKEAKMIEADYRAKEREIISEIKKAYSEYFLKEHEVALHSETKRVLDRMAASAEARYETGSMAYREVLRIHTQLSLITNEVAKHAQELETAAARLNALLGREAREPLHVAVAVPEREIKFSAENLMRLTLEKSPELEALNYGLEATKTDVKSAWLELLPDGLVRIEARQFSGEGRIREYDQFYGLEVPLFSLVERFGQIKEKRADKRAAAAAWEDMKNKMFFEVQKALSEYESHDRTVKMYRADVIPKAEAILAAGLAEYESGTGNFLEVMEAQIDLTEYRHHYFEALAMREQSFAELERVIGVELGGNF